MEAARNNLDKISCPHCNAILTPYPGYATWCDNCNWNLQPEHPVEPRNLFEKMYEKVGIKSSKHLLDAMLQSETRLSKISGVKLLTYILAACVHLLSVGLVAIGCSLMTLYSPSPLLILTGIVCVLFGWVSRPKGYKPETPPLSREQFPVLYRTIDEISSALHTRKVDGIVIDGDYNAGYAQLGYRRKPILQLGLPLVSILGKQEFVAMVSHEMAHGMNGDFQRGFIVQTAIRTLISWHDIIIPDRIFNTRDYSFLLALGMIVPNLILWLLSKMIVSLLYLICHLNWHHSQCAEYMADRIAAKTAGKEAALMLLNKLNYGHLFDFTVLQAINNHQSIDLFQQFRQLVGQVPESELERIQRRNLLMASRLNVTHPPTANRISFLNSLDSALPLYQLTDDQYRQLLFELAKIAAPIETKILDDVKSQVLGY